MFNKVMKITESCYKEVARQLEYEISDKEFMAGTIIAEDYGVFDYDIIIYRSNEDIVDVVPIWWEFHTYEDEGNGSEILNNFDFSKLKQELIKSYNYEQR